MQHVCVVCGIRSLSVLVSEEFFKVLFYYGTISIPNRKGFVLSLHIFLAGKESSSQNAYFFYTLRHMQLLSRLD